MPEEQSTIPGVVVPPRVGVKDPEIIEAYHRCIGMADALYVVNDLHINMPGIVLATEAIKSEIASERASATLCPLHPIRGPSWARQRVRRGRIQPELAL